MHGHAVFEKLFKKNHRFLAKMVFKTVIKDIAV